VVDLDTVAPRPPAFDVGYAIGQLLVMSQLRFRHPAPGAAAAMAFWDVFARRGTVAWRHVAVQVARTLLQSTHYELCDLRTGRTELLRCLVSWLPKWLGSNGPETLGTLSAPR